MFQKRKIKFYIEKLAPVLICASTLLLSFVFPKDDLISFGVMVDRDFFSVFISVFSTFFAFLLTALSLMVTVQNYSFERMKQSGAFYAVLRYLKSAIIWCLVALVFSLICFVMPKLLAIFYNCFFAIVFGAFASVFRIIYVFHLMIGIICKERNSNN